MAGKALILVDFEKEWINEESDYYVGDLTEVIEKTNRLIDFCRKIGYKIIFTRHVERGSEDAFAENSENTEIIKRLHKEKTDDLLTKNKISPFYRTKLEEKLKGIKEMVVCGILTNLCVRSLIEGAYDRELDITVIEDCCAARDEETQEFTFKDLKATREEIKFVEVADFVRG